MPSLRNITRTMNENPLLTKQLMKAVLERGPIDFPTELPFISPPDGEGCSFVFLDNPEPPHITDHSKHDYYRDVVHPWRPRVYVEKGEEFDLSHNNGKWEKIVKS